MSNQNTGSALLAGTPGIASTAPAMETASINVTGEVATPAVEGQEAVLTHGQGKVGGDGWYSKLEDPDLRGYAELRNWKNEQELVKSYKHLETLLGEDKANNAVILPKGEDDKDGWNNIYKRLGRPDNAAEYGLDKAEGADPEFAKNVSNWMHEAGLNNQQAQTLANKWNEFNSTIANKSEQEYVKKSEQDMTELRSEWGQNFDRNVELARRAMAGFKISPEVVDTIERKHGTKAMMEMLSNIGNGFSEHLFAGANTAPFGNSPEAAKVELGRLQKDPSWIKRYKQGDHVARSEFHRLTAAIAGVDGMKAVA